MRITTIIILAILSIKSYSQVLEMPLSKQSLKKDVPFPPPINKDGTFKFDEQLIEKEARIEAWPSQKIEFDISVNSSGHKVFICDTLGHILYTQRKRKGYYHYDTFGSYKYFVIYDIDKFQHKSPVGYNPINDFHRIIMFGKKDKIDGIVNIAASKIN